MNFCDNGQRLELIETIGQLDPQKYIVWIQDKNGNYTFINTNVPYNSIQANKKEENKFEFIEEERFGKKVFTFKVPVEEQILGISVIKENERLICTHTREISKVLNHFDHPSINMYVKRADNRYVYFSKGCLEQLRLSNGNEKKFPNLPVLDTEILGVDQAHYLREIDGKVIFGNKPVIAEEKLPDDEAKTYLSVKIPFELNDQKMMFGYSVEIQEYIDKIAGKNNGKTLEQMIASVNHDISASLNSTLQSLEFLKITEKCPEKMNFVQSSIYSIQSLKNSIKMFINDEFEGQASIEKLSYQELYDLILGMYYLPASSKGLELTVNKCEKVFDNVPIYVYKTKFIRVVLNLVNNAVKYTNEGRVSVNFSYLYGNFMLEVADTGGGFPEEKLQQIRDNEVVTDKNKIDENSGYGWDLILQYINYLGAEFIVQSDNLGSKVILMLKD